jgi:hypothetical protein
MSGLRACEGPQGAAGARDRAKGNDMMWRRATEPGRRAHAPPRQSPQLLHTRGAPRGAASAAGAGTARTPHLDKGQQHKQVLHLVANRGAVSEALQGGVGVGASRMPRAHNKGTPGSSRGRRQLQLPPGTKGPAVQHAEASAAARVVPHPGGGRQVLEVGSWPHLAPGATSDAAPVERQPRARGVRLHQLVAHRLLWAIAVIKQGQGVGCSVTAPATARRQL